MDTRKYGSAFIKPDDVRDGARQERIINVSVSEKYDNLVLELESGDQLSLNPITTRILNRAYGIESDDWRGHVVELSLGTYTTRDGEAKETVTVKPVSLRQPGAGNGGDAATRKPVPAPRADMDDEIPY